LDKTSNGGCSGLGDWLPFAGTGNHSLGGAMNSSTNAPYSGNNPSGFNPRGVK